MTRSLLLALLACGPEPAPAPGVRAEEEDTAPVDAPDTAAPRVDLAEDLAPLAPPRLLRRVSLDLRGRLPTVAELDAVEADPDRVSVYAAEWMGTSEFEERMVDLLAEHWWTRIDTFQVVHLDYGLQPGEAFSFERQVGEEPLRLIARIVAEDRQWSEVVTADHTMSTAFLSRLWPVDYPAGAAGWQEATYTDGRPAVGVLSTNGLWWRYTTTDSNMNRSRAAAISRLLLCEDYLARPISLSGAGDVSDPEVAIRTDPYCVACHASIDPVAASLFGFWWLSLYSRIEQDAYHPEREALAEAFLGVDPAWYGRPMTGLTDLGWQISQDHRFYTCAVETFARLYWRRPLDRADHPRVEALRAAFLDGEARPQQLLLDILQTREYQAGGVVEGGDPDAAARARTVRLVSPEQWALTAWDLAGWQWTYQGFDQLRNDEIGYRVLAGGVDGWAVTEPQADPSLPWSLVVERVAQGLADRIVQRELEQGPTILLAGAGLDLRPGDAGFESALARFWWRLSATRLQPADRDALVALWEAVDAVDGPAMAWRSMITVMLRDPLVATY